VGSSDKIHKILGWEPKYDDLSLIIETAWKWHQKEKK
jgi:UDP-glucose 4-epimerase